MERSERKAWSEGLVGPNDELPCNFHKVWVNKYFLKLLFIKYHHGAVTVSLVVASLLYHPR